MPVLGRRRRNYTYGRRVRRRFTRRPANIRTRRYRRRYAPRRRTTGWALAGQSARPNLYARSINLKSGYAPALASRIHVTNSVFMSTFAKKMYRQLGEKHMMKYQASGQSSTGAVNMKLCFRMMPSIDKSTSYSWQCPTSSNWTSIADFGTHSYTTGYPSGIKKFLWAWTKITIYIKQIDEDGKVRIEWVKSRKNTPYSVADLLTGYNWDVEQPNDGAEFYKILYSKTFVFDDPVESGVTKGRQRKLEFFLPMNRMCKTYDNVDATSASSWNGNTLANDHTFLTIASNDLTDVDSQNFEYEMYVQHCWYTGEDSG